MDLDRAADELYGLPPGDFVARRTELAREAADRAVVKQIRALRRPTVPAWAVNRFVRDEPGLLADLLAAGSAVREAWAGGSGRPEAERVRAKAVAAAVRATLALAGRDLPEQVRREIEDTFQAAVVDPDAAAELAAGRLTAPLTHVGFTFAGSAFSGPPPPGPASGKNDAPAAEKPSREDPRLLLRRLEVAAAQAEAAARAAESALADRHAELARLEAEQEELTRRLAALSDRLREARAGTGPAERSAKAARSEADTAARRLAQARATPS